MKRAHFIVAIVSLSVASVLGGWIANERSDDDLFELKKNFEIFGALYQEVIINYVDDVRPGPFMTAGVEAMMSRLDPYSQYYDQAVNADFDLMRRGPLADVGLNIGMRNGRVTVLAPDTGTSAYIQGVRTGDQILEVDGISTSDLSVQEVAGLLRGDSGSSVLISVSRTGEPRTLQFSLQRSIARTENVAYSGYLNNDTEAAIGYVRLNAFGTRSAREIRRALREMARTDGLKGVVLDLRDNPGGILSEAIETVSLFVPKGTPVVSTRGRIDGITQSYPTTDDPFFEDTPIVVLVNGISASASEIVAGAFQDLDRAVIIGETTYGKGLVQVMRQLPYNTSMKLTIGHYYTPSGRDIQSREISSSAASISTPEVLSYRTLGGRTVRSGVGIEPDIRVEQSVTSELETALLRSGAFFQFAGSYVEEHGEISPEAFDLNDEDVFSEFAGWLQVSNFSYESSSEVLIDSLAHQLARSGYGDVLESLEQLRTQTIESKREDVNRYKEPLTNHIRREVAARYLSEPEQIRWSLGRDPVVEQATDVLKSPDTIRSVLGS